MLSPVWLPSLIVGGALLIIAIIIFWLWVSQNKTNRRLNRLER
jgi:hypothetical protein